MTFVLYYMLPYKCSLCSDMAVINNANQLFVHRSTCVTNVLQPYFLYIPFFPGCTVIKEGPGSLLFQIVHELLTWISLVPEKTFTDSGDFRIVNAKDRRMNIIFRCIISDSICTFGIFVQSVLKGSNIRFERMYYNIFLDALLLRPALSFSGGSVMTVSGCDNDGSVSDDFRSMV